MTEQDQNQEPSPTNKLALIIVGVVALALGLIIAAAVTNVAEDMKSTTDQPKGIVSIGGEFNLQTIDGPITLSSLKGKVVALYFGFASCPDVCPTSLGILSSAIKSLGDEQRSQIVPLFISVDPDRDTLEKLDEYAKAFHPDMIGATGTREQIDEATGRYRMLYKLVPLEDSAMGYTVDHASIIYIIGKNGIVQSVAQHGTPPKELAQKLVSALDI